MPLFSGRYRYNQPERFSPEEARERRLQSALERSRKELEGRTEPLSLANRIHLDRLKEFEVKFGKELEARRRQFKKSPQEVRRDKAAISRLFQLQAKQQELLQRVAGTQRAKVYQAVAGDRRFFNPFGDAFNPRTIYGTEAHVGTSAFSRRVFRNPVLAVPCIQRAIRREVMFAFGHGGVGHKAKKRRNEMSLIGC